METKEDDTRPRLAALSDADVIAAADREQQAYSAHLRSFFTFIAEVDRRKLWAAEGCRDIVQWISGRYDETNHTARLMAEAAHSLESLPLISNAFVSGRVSRDKVVQLARFATPATEQDLLRWAARVTTRTVRKRAERERRKALTDEQAEAEREAQVGIDRSRYLEWWLTGNDEAVRIEALLPLAEGMMAVKSLRRLASRKPRDPDLIDDLAVDQFRAAGAVGDGAGVPLADQSPEDEADSRTHDQRMADAFVELCSQSIDADSDIDRATVMVECELSALTGDGSGAEISGGPLISQTTLDRLLCDCRLEVAIRDGERGLIGAGRASRTPPAHVYRQVLRRDGGCSFPGCGTRRYISAHHIAHWTRDEGPSDYGNLTIVCGFHHKLIHERGWGVKLTDRDEAVWFRPTGEMYEPRGSPL